MCKGSGKVATMSFVDPSQTVMKSCHVCHGRGTLQPIPMDESRAREILGEAVQEDGSLHRFLHQLIVWVPGLAVRLSGEFTADELEAIAFWMRK